MATTKMKDCRRWATRGYTVSLYRYDASTYDTGRGGHVDFVRYELKVHLSTGRANGYARRDLENRISLEATFYFTQTTLPDLCDLADELLAPGKDRLRRPPEPFFDRILEAGGADPEVAKFVTAVGQALEGCGQGAREHRKEKAARAKKGLEEWARNMREEERERLEEGAAEAAAS